MHITIFTKKKCGFYLKIEVVCIATGYFLSGKKIYLFENYVVI